jgi:FMN-dependent NADH-azoreductase
MEKLNIGVPMMISSAALISATSYNQASGYLRQVLAWIGIKDVEFILAGRARAGATGETALEEFGAAVRSAAVAAPAIAA